ncbi:hypothetical protein SVIOM342S_04222 [Streptomyces violaceorubidus]
MQQYADTGNSGRRVTSYTYDKRGNREKVTDPAGNVWSYTYDARGRVASATDPDTGTTETEYDDADRPVKVTNARGQSIHTAFDVLGRTTAVREGSATAAPVKESTYDSLPGALGQPVAAIRHDASGDYITRATGYDAQDPPTGQETVIPANSMTAGVSGTYGYTYSYSPTGRPLTVTMPAKGGLAAEKVITRYNDDGLAESTSGLSWYTSDATYSPYGEVLRTVSGAQPYRVWTTNFVDAHTGRLQRTVTDRETASPHAVNDSYYSYDASGTITSNATRGPSGLEGRHPRGRQRPVTCHSEIRLRKGPHGNGLERQGRRLPRHALLRRRSHAGERRPPRGTRPQPGLLDGLTPVGEVGGRAQAVGHRHGDFPE